jgi:hypothetical protein
LDNGLKRSEPSADTINVKSLVPEEITMSPERTQAYRRVIHTLRELGPSKLQDNEQDRIRSAADSLIFSSDLTQDVDALHALEDAGCLFRALVESGRWEQVTATRLTDDLYGCGPETRAQLQAA